MLKWFTGLYRQSVRSMRDNRGTGTLIFGLLFLLPLMTFGMFLVESRILYIERDIADDAVVMAALASLRCVNAIEAAYGEYVLDPVLAREVFEEYLRKNLKLDSSLNPMPGSIASGPVTVEDFRVYNPGGVPAQCPLGTPIERTSVHVVVRIPADRPALRGLFGDRVYIKIHRDVDNYYSLEE